jgi:hypothetical protein
MKTSGWIVMLVVSLILVGMYAQYKFPLFSVLPSGQYRSNSDCTFITNVPSGGSYKQTGAWISVKIGSQMMAHGYSGYSTYSCDSSDATKLPFKTIEGYDICTRIGYGTRMYIREGNFGLVFDTSKGADAITSCGGTTPIATCNSNPIQDCPNGLSCIWNDPQQKWICVDPNLAVGDIYYIKNNQCTALPLNQVYKNMNLAPFYESIQKCQFDLGCTPSCSGKQCGDNGCNGVCGTCQTGFTCSSSYQCVSTTGVCTVGTRECLSTSTYKTCLSSGTWSGILSCGVGASCSNGQCIAGSCNTDADTNCDGLISSNELNSYINKYLNGQITRQKLGDSIQIWSG